MLARAKRFNVLMCGRRWGKTTLAERVAAAGSMRGAPWAWFAPTYKLLAEPWRNVKRVYAPVIKDVSEQEKRLEFINGGTMDFWSMDTPDPARGRKYAGAVVDEPGIAANLEECWTGAIRPTLTDLKGGAWFTGTPKGRRYFYQLFLRGEDPSDPVWQSFRLPTVSNPFIDPAEVEEARKQLPHAVFQQEYEAIPSDDAGNPFGIDNIRAAISPPSVKRPVAFGIDLARKVDFTVVYGIDDDGRWCVFDRWQAVPWTETVEKIVRLVGEVPAYVDSTGLGDVVLDSLQRRLPNVHGYTFSPKSKQDLMYCLWLALNNRATTIPAGVTAQELECFEYQYHAAGVRYSAPDGMHDDCVYGLAMAVKCKEDRVGCYGASAVVPGQKTADELDRWEEEDTRARSERAAAFFSGADVGR